ncbi:hypothetical protein LSTR_LSTR006299 [Laodelphax striatellus]|uniref:Uncharacterized protein n=1 Tax=Laodelphax striatellus TaxID=195883 RepID=A0A482X5V2_LAOST|nr:hypothetical protein LSTR_LSTR006299 [Laodelphax striatellus]
MFFTGIVLSHLILFSYSPVECGLLIPEELPSFLSLLYSIVPPLRIGKDSRFGAGFRIGPNADLQFLVELGPQQNTLPIGPGPPGDIDDALPGVRRHVGSTTKPPPPPPTRRRLPPAPTRNNWGLNYIPNRRQKEPINQTVPNNFKSDAAKLSWRGKSQSQNDVKHQTSASIQRKIVRLPDSLIVYNNTQLATNTDVEMINNSQENYGNTVSVEDRNKVQKLTNKEQSTNNISNKNNGLSSNYLEETVQSLRKSEKKRNEQFQQQQQQTNQRPRALRDWVFSWFDGLKPPKSATA